MIREKHTIDATGQAVGRLATQIATILRGKHKPSFQPHIDGGDIVEVVNAKLLKFTGKKLAQTVFKRYSGYPGGIKTTKLSDMFSRDPGAVIRHAVREMLPPVRFRDDMLKRLIIK
jgi:large subunit ribosomal protein L13